MSNFPNFDDPRSGNLVGTWEGSIGSAYETSQGWFYREEYLLHNLLANGIYILESGYIRDYYWDPINQQKGSITQSIDYQPAIGAWGTDLDEFTAARTGFNYYNILSATGLIYEDIDDINPNLAWNIGPYYELISNNTIQLASTLDEFAEVNLTGTWERTGDGSPGSFSPYVYVFEFLRQQDLDGDGTAGNSFSSQKILTSHPVDLAGLLMDLQGTNVIIPNAFHTIGDYAFYQKPLTSVDIPSSVTSIGTNAFRESQLQSISIENGLIGIGDDAFKDAQITNLDIPTSVTRIGSGAFHGNQLTSLEIPDNVTTIKDWAFQDNQIRELIISEGITNISKGVFSGNQLTAITIPESVTSIGEWAFNRNELTSIVIPDNVTSIGENAFANNPLTSVNISADAEFDLSIFPEDAFITRRGEAIAPSDILISESGFGENINSETIVASFSTIDSDQSGGHIYSLQPGSGDTDNKKFRIKDGQLFILEMPNYEQQSTYSIRVQTEDSSGLKLQKSFTLNVNNIEEEVLTAELAQLMRQIQGPDIIIPSEYTSIADNAFKETNLASLIIPNTITSIGNNAFSSNLQLTSIAIPESVQFIGNHAFADCGLLDVTVPDSVESIGEYAFGNNYGMKSAKIGDGVITIGDSAFYNNQLTSLIIGKSVQEIGEKAFSGDVNFYPLINQLSTVELPESVRTIGQLAFAYNNLSSIEIPDGVISIGHNAFKGNPLEQITISSEADYNLAFDGPIYPEIIRRGITAPSDLLISESSFDENIDSGSVVATFSSIDADAGDSHVYSLVPGPGDDDNLSFAISDEDNKQLKITESPDFESKSSYSIRVQTEDSRGQKLQKIFELSVNDVEEDLTITRRIASQIVQSQNSNIIIPEIYSSIAAEAFMNKRIESVQMPSTMRSIGDRAFAYQNKKPTNLNTLVLNNGLVSIGYQSFYKSNLKSVTIPSSISSISSGAFAKNDLTSAVLPNGITSIASGLFENNKLKNIDIPQSVSRIGTQAFYRNKLTGVDLPSQLKYIRYGAFMSNRLSSIEIPENTIEIGGSAFAQNRLSNVSFKSGLKRIENGAFFSNQITDLLIPDSVIRVGDKAFRGNPIETVYMSPYTNFRPSSFPENAQIIFKRPTDISLSSSNFTENIAANSFIASLSTSDVIAAGDNHSYSLAPGDGDDDNNKFKIQNNKLKIKESPDFEGQETYLIRIQSTNSRGMSLAKSFILHVNDINEDPVDINLSSLSFNENIVANSVIASLDTLDEDAGDSHTYSLIPGDGDEDNIRFKIQNNKLKIKESPDFEAQESYLIRIQSEDSGGLKLEKELVLSVNDIKPETIQSSESFTLPAGVENLTLTGTDHIKGTGNELKNKLIGNAGDNILDGKADKDILRGLGGNDVYIVNQNGDKAIEKSNDGIDLIQSSVSISLPNNVENLVLKGSKKINGKGNGLDNIITGNQSNNKLEGKRGRDILTGEAGSDTFIYRSIRDSRASDTSRDQITDFNSEELDLIDLSKIDAYQLNSGNQSFAYINTAKFSGLQGEVRFNPRAGRLEINTGADTKADMHIELPGISTFDAGNLIL